MRAVDRTLREHGRAVAWLAVCAGVSFLAVLAGSGTGVYVPAALAAAVLGAVAIVPFRPAEAFALGAAAEAVYMVAARPGSPGLEIFLLALALAAAGFSAVLQARQGSMLRAAETLASAQLRAQLAENAASIGNLAAALTHEINTPLGVLKSSIDTLLSPRTREVPGAEAGLRRSVEASMERLRELAARLERFTHLNDAETKTADLNELVTDAALLLEQQIEIEQCVRIRFDFTPLPPVNCRPSLLSQVFSSLLSNALNAVECQGSVLVSTRRNAETVDVRIHDDGRGIPPGEVDHLFSPVFRVANGRVSSGNWSLFNARQVVFEHGGDIQVESAEGKGTTVTVSIPLGPAAG